MRLLALIIAALALDAFFIPGAFAGFRLYTGCVLVLYLLAERRDAGALFAAALYGGLLDAAAPGVPFGTFLGAHVAAWFLFSALMRSRPRTHEGPRALAAGFGMAFAYAAWTEFAAYASVSLFTGLPATFDAEFLLRVALAAGASTCAAASAALAYRAVRNRIRTWFLIT